MSVTVNTPVFDGPFDLLLHLILKEEVELYEVSLSSVVDAYITELERLENLDLELATEFLLIAAILVELKTRRMLPDKERDDLEDEFGLWEERDLLLARLLECKTFKDAAVILRRLSIDASQSWPRRAGLEERFLGLAPDLLAGVTLEDIRNSYISALTPRPTNYIDTYHIAPIRLSVADAVKEVVDEIPTSGSISFKQITMDLVDRIEVIVRFLAVLELYKQGVIEIDQMASFGSIEMRWAEDAGPANVDLIDTYDG